jgi:hypothetical protein
LGCAKFLHPTLSAQAVQHIVVQPPRSAPPLM